jgi:putative DNA primase/helicase
MRRPTHKKNKAPAVNYPDLLSAGIALIEGGVNIIPVDDRKTPLGAWKPYQSRRTTIPELEKWCKNPAVHGLAMIGGEISGGLVVFDFDVPGFFERFIEAVKRNREVRELAYLLPIQQTGSTNHQLAFRCGLPLKNDKLAWVYARNEQGRETAIETRAAGGYAVVAPSYCPRAVKHGIKHKQAYKVLQGNFAAVPTIADSQATILLEVARSLNEMPLTMKEMKAAKLPPNRNGEEVDGGVIGVFNKVFDIQTILERNKYVRRGNRYLAPDSTTGVPGLHIFEDGRCYSHHSNDLLNNGHSHNAFSAFCVLEHGDDVRAAVKAAAEMLGPEAPAFEPNWNNGNRTHAGRSAAEADGEAYTQEEETTRGKDGFTDAELLNFAKAGQVGDSRLFIRLFTGKFVYDHAAGRWYRWGGHYWIDDQVETVLIALDRVVDLYHQAAGRCAWEKAQAIRDGGEKAAKDAAARESIFLKKIASLQNKKWRRDVLEFAAAGDGSLGIAGKEWDQSTMLIACPNGVIDLNTRGFRPGKPDDYIKVACPTEWKGINEPAPEWEKFQLQIFNDDVKLGSYFRRLAGYAISGQRVERVLPIPWGIGWNGKGTLFETLEHTLGDLAGPVPSEILLEDGKNYRTGGSPTPEIMRLRGKRLVWASETNEHRKLNPGKVKWLTGGDTLVGRDPFGKRLVEFSPSHTLFLMTNHRPKANPDDFALWQRIALIPFGLSFVDNPTEPHERQRDKHIVDRLKKEAPGILARLVRGFFEWEEEGLNPPATVQDATAEYREAEDTIGQFISEQCVVNESASVKAGEFYGKYKSWCEENGHKPVWGNIFGQSMAVKFPKKDTKTGVYYSGVGIRRFDTNG